MPPSVVDLHKAPVGLGRGFGQKFPREQSLSEDGMKTDILPVDGICQSCGERSAACSLEEQKFVYGAGDDAVSLTVTVPVWTCESCGFQYTDETAEERRHEAVCHHLGRLSPAEVLSVRKDIGMSQDEFADLTGIGIASIKRWELGNQIQNASIDKYLRLVRIPNNAGLLRLMATVSPDVEPTFRTQVTSLSVVRAETFKLRPMRLSGAA